LTNYAARVNHHLFQLVRRVIILLAAALIRLMLLPDAWSFVFLEPLHRIA
jgi:hypothetical protein